MLKHALVALLVVHGLIHLMGFAKAFGLAELEALAGGVSRAWGLLWATAAALFVAAGAARALRAQPWWMIAALACVVSQVAIAAHWSDAKAGTVANVLVLLAVVVAAGDWAFARQTRALITRLDGAPVAAAGAVEPGSLDDLPAPVRRYLRAVLPQDAPTIAAVTLEQTGMIAIGEGSDGWKPFRATHRARTAPPGFVWAARVEMAPGLAVHVHDAYVDGEGILQPRALGLIPLGAQRDRGGELARGELMRLLAEAPWYPTMLLPGGGVRWAAIDAGSARATLSDHGVSASLTFTFDDDGLIAAVRAQARGRSVGERIVPTPWEGRWARYEMRDGVRVPLQAEVAWLLPEGRQSYWRGEVTSIRYERAGSEARARGERGSTRPAGSVPLPGGD